MVMNILSTGGASMFLFLFLLHSVIGQKNPANPGEPFFEKFRPQFHFIPPRQWQNDACGPFYEPNTHTYHMFYQYNPYGAYWGNMTWGHATSKDQIIWEDQPHALLPVDKYDNLGVFSGNTLLNGIDGLPTIFYSGVTGLPIAWKVPYIDDCEHILYATSKDNGQTWQKGAEPLIAKPPPGKNVTTWHDPFVFTSTALDNQFGYQDPQSGLHKWMLIPGGLRGAGPRIFLYESLDFRSWNFVGFLLSVDPMFEFGDHVLTGSFGQNFEMTQYFELPDPITNVSVPFMIVGTEGGRGTEKNDHYVLWLSGELTYNGSTDPELKPSLELSMVGVLDYGLLYGSNIYRDTKNENQLIAIGWLTEENGYAGDEPNAMGWSGMLCLPRVLEYIAITDIHDPENRLNPVVKGPWTVHDGPHRGRYPTKVLKTLATRPVDSLRMLRTNPDVRYTPMTFTESALQIDIGRSRAFEASFTATDIPKNSCIGFIVRANADGKELTRVYYDDKEEAIVVDRNQSSDLSCWAPRTPVMSADKAPFTLYNIVRKKQDDTYEVIRETLRLRVFVDVSVIEVYANERLALTSRIYPCESGGATPSDRIALFTSVEGTSVSELNVWTRMLHAWPKRQSNTETGFDCSKCESNSENPECAKCNPGSNNTPKSGTSSIMVFQFGKMFIQNVPMLIGLTVINLSRF